MGCQKKYKTYAEALAARREHDRWRYANDPEYRDKRLAVNKAWIKKEYHRNPDYRAYMQLSTAIWIGEHYGTLSKAAAAKMRKVRTTFTKKHKAKEA